MSNEILSVKNISKIYESSGGGFGRKNKVSALDGVSFNLVQGETLGIVGESGCGKSTLGRIISRLDSPTSGEIIYKGNDIAKKSLAAMRPLRKEIQFIFQDPYASLNPRRRVQDLIAVYSMLSERSDHALHLGLTEAGMGSKGIVASSAAMGYVLQHGIGDTVRVSLTPEPNGDRTREVQVAQELLQVMGFRQFVPVVAACPGCGRTTSTVFQELAQKIQDDILERFGVGLEMEPNLY